MRGQDGHGGAGGVLSRRPSDETMVQSSEVHSVHSVVVVLPGIGSSACFIPGNIATTPWPLEFRAHEVHILLCSMSFCQGQSR